MTDPIQALICWRDRELAGKHELPGLVQAARDQGLPMREIAAALGMTRQNLYQRLGRLDKSNSETDS